jgi:hypothetical protein
MKEKIKTITEGIFLTAFIVFASAVDSPNMLIPVIGVIVSLLGLVTVSNLKV